MQHARRKLSATTVLLVPDDTTVVAYHTLSAARVDLGELPQELQRKYPRFSEGLPATLIGRLAVSSEYEGQGHGSATLMDALHKALIATDAVASAFVIVRAIDDRAVRFYTKHGFAPLPDDPRRLFLPMATVARLFDS